MTQVYVTEHAKKRMKERAGLKKKAMERMASRAYDKGMTIKDTKGLLNNWMTYRAETHNCGHDMRIYGDKLYLFEGHVLVTVMQVPQNLMSRVHKHRAKRS